MSTNNKNNHSIIFMISGLFLLIIVLFMIQIKHGFAAVTLIDFTVTYEENQVKLSWNTATEPDNTLFFIQRSDTANENFQQITVYNPDTGFNTRSIFPKGDSVSGGNYLVYDKNITKGINYFYQLVAVDRNNLLQYLSPTNIENPPQTSTPTSTATHVPITPKKTKTKSNTISSTPLPPTVTAHIVYPTATAQPTNPPASPTVEENTPTPSEAVLAIPTLGLPSVTMIFPDTATSILEVTTTPAAGTIPNNASWFTPQRITVIGLIVAVWVILGGGFFFVLKKIE